MSKKCQISKVHVCTKLILQGPETFLPCATGCFYEFLIRDLFLFRKLNKNLKMLRKNVISRKVCVPKIRNSSAGGNKGAQATDDTTWRLLPHHTRH
jgi:hypothetical protein